MNGLKGWKPYKPPEGTVPTLIHDIYGDGIIVYFPLGDKEAPRNCEIGIRSAQLGMSVEKHKAMIKPNSPDQ